MLFCHPRHMAALESLCCMPSVSLVSSCRTTLFCISTMISMLHSLCVQFMLSCLPSSVLEPRCLKWCPLCSSSPRILTGSLHWSFSCPNVKSMNNYWVFGLLIVIRFSSDVILQSLSRPYFIMSVSSSPVHNILSEV